MNGLGQDATPSRDRGHSVMRLFSLIIPATLFALGAVPGAALCQAYDSPRHGAGLNRGLANADMPNVAGERVFDIPIDGQAMQRVLYATPGNPVATIIMLPGGAGDVGLAHNGDVRHDDNFVVRTRAQWAARGYAVLIPDTIDHANLRGLRSSPAYAALVQDLVDFAHRQASGPVFLLGTSQGSTAAMNGAAHARPGSVAGVVLTESVSVLGHSGETVFSADPEDVRMPALVLANRDDRCDVAPPENAPRIAAAMTHATNVQVLYVTGGVNRSQKPCGSLTPHGYYGIEEKIIAQVDRWMRSHLPA